MAGERLAGQFLSKALNKALPKIGQYATYLAPASAVAEKVTPFIEGMGDYVAAPGIRGNVAQFISGLNPQVIGQATQDLAGFGGEIAAGAGFDAIRGLMNKSPQNPSKQQIDPRQQARYNAMFMQQMQMGQGMQPNYAPAPMEQAAQQGRLIAQQGNNRIVSQYYYNPSDPLTAAAKIYAAMPKTSFPVGVI